MKKILAATLLMASMACTSENTGSSDAYIANSEVFTTELGSRKAYGVRLFLYSPDGQPKNLGYQVSFYQSDKLWMDTIYAEISPGDTLEGEVIFTESRVKKDEDVSFKTQSFEIE
ncbi:MAG: hypothetical protein RLP14_06610 [Owenweeksia sp.]